VSQPHLQDICDLIITLSPGTVSLEKLAILATVCNAFEDLLDEGALEKGGNLAWAIIPYYLGMKAWPPLYIQMVGRHPILTIAHLQEVVDLISKRNQVELLPGSQERLSEVCAMFVDLLAKGEDLGWHFLSYA
jgi:hypothetical protein